MSKIKHVALIKFKESTTPEQIDSAFATVMDLSENIEGLEDYVSGVNSSPQDFSQGYTHGFVMTFADAAARDAYIAHPEHQKLHDDVLPLLESIAIVDFEV